MEKQMDTGYALVQCCLYRSRNVPAALTAWELALAGFSLALLVAHKHEHLGQRKFT